MRGGEKKKKQNPNVTSSKVQIYSYSDCFSQWLHGLASLGGCKEGAGLMLLRCSAAASCPVPRGLAGDRCCWGLELGPVRQDGLAGVQRCGQLGSAACLRCPYLLARGSAASPGAGGKVPQPPSPSGEVPNPCECLRTSRLEVTALAAGCPRRPRG